MVKTSISKRLLIMKNIILFLFLFVLFMNLRAQSLIDIYSQKDTIDLTSQVKLTDRNIQLEEYKPKYNCLYKIIDIVDSIHPLDLDLYILNVYGQDNQIVCIPEKCKFQEIFIPNLNQHKFIGFWKYSNKVILLYGAQSRFLFKKRTRKQRYILYSSEFPEEIDYRWPVFLLRNGKIEKIIKQ